MMEPSLFLFLHLAPSLCFFAADQTPVTLLYVSENRFGKIQNKCRLEDEINCVMRYFAISVTLCYSKMNIDIGEMCFNNLFEYDKTC